MENSRAVGLALTCGVCIVWPLLWAVAGWRLRGWVNRQPGGATVWERFSKQKQSQPTPGEPAPEF
ncbi:MAG TPA: hypothetical protein VII92_04840 [Anaerolineae bacterium]